tara:strand:+ start:375 stop:890 length:516 start_codon:yes stop_codon:yes gene_type:complete
MSENTNTIAEVTVEQILTTSNPDIFQLQLRQEVEKPAESNQLGFFLQGYPGVGDSIERRVAFQTVSSQFIEEYSIVEGCNLGDTIDKPCQLIVTETFNKRVWTNKDGSKGEQSPKVNPSTGDTLMRDGRPIYRNCELSFDMSAVCTYIEHDKANAVKTVKPEPVAAADLEF